MVLLSACIEIPQCVKLSPGFKHDDKGRLYIEMSNSCDYSLLISLYIRDRGNNVLSSLSIELGAGEEKHVEIPLENTIDSVVVSGEWSLKGTSLKIPLNEITVNR